MIDWIKKHWEVLTGVPLVSIVTFLNGKYKWLRLRPKEKAEVEKVQIDVKKVESDIQSKNIEDSLSIVKTTLDANGTLMAQLTYISAIAEKVQKENVELKILIADFGEKVKMLTHDLMACLSSTNCQDDLKKLREKYGL